MKVTIHQPEHFPYMGFFQKIESSDLFIVLDDVKFRKNYFQNRNKVKTMSGEDMWITVPVEKGASSKKIKDVVVSPDPHWRKKIFKKIYQNYKFDTEHIYAYEKLVEINMASIRWAMSYMNIQTEVVFSSDIGVEGTGTQMLVNLLKSVGAKKYVSGQKGKDYLDLSLFEDIKVDFFNPKVSNHYSCLHNLLGNMR